MKVEVEIHGQLVTVECPFCPADPPPPDPRLIETDRFVCPQCRREFVAMSARQYAEAITASRPALLVADLLRLP